MTQKNIITLEKKPEIEVTVQMLFRDWFNAREEYHHKYTLHGKGKLARQVGWKIIVNNKVFYTSCITETKDLIIFEHNEALKYYDYEN